MVCPNINTREWKLLEKQVGTKEAYRVWATSGNTIPAPVQPAKIKKDIAFKNLVPNKTTATEVEQRLMQYNLDNNTSHFIEVSPGPNNTRRLDLVMNYLPFNVFEQIKIDSKGRDFISTVPLQGAKAAQLKINFEVNAIDEMQISKEIDKKVRQLEVMTNPDIKVLEQQKEMYALDTNSAATADEQLTEKLKTILAKNGIIIRTGIETLKTRKGQSAEAITDLINKIILVAKGTQEAAVLPEEASHLIIASMDPNSENYQILMQEVVKTQEYQDVVTKYSEEYNNDATALKQEALGQLLAKQIVQVYERQEAEKADSKLVKLLKAVWQRARRMFGRIVYSKYQKDLESILGKTAEGILNEKVGIKNVQDSTLGVREMYSLTDIMTPTDIQETPREEVREPIINRFEREPLTDEERTAIENKLKQRLRNIIEQLEKRRKIMKSTSGKTKQELKHEADRIRVLERNLENLVLLGSIDSYLEQAQFDLKGKTLTTYRRGQDNEQTYIPGALNALQDMEVQLQQGTVQDINEMARKLRDVNNFIISYKENVKEIIGEIEDMAKYDTGSTFIQNIAARASEVNTLIDQVEKKYYNISAEIFSKFLGGYLGNRNQTEELAKLDIKAALMQAEKDIGFFQLWANAMAESGDDILKLIDSAVKTAKFMGQQDARNDQKDLLAAQEKFEKSGRKDVSFVYERDDNGNITGNLVSQHGVNYQKFFDARQAYKESLGPFPQRDDYRTNSQWTSAISEWKSNMRAWDEANTQDVPNKDLIIARKGSELNEFNYALWEDITYEQTLEGDKIARSNSELKMPKKRLYNDNAYSSLNNAQKEFLDTVWEVKRRTDNKMNPKFVKPQQAPMIRKDIVETVKTGKASDVKKGLRRIRESFVRTEDEQDFGNQGEETQTDEEQARQFTGEQTLTDVRGREVQFLPVFFNKKLKDMKDLSLDIVATMSAQSAMSNDYYQMENIIHLLEVGKDFINDRRGVPIKENLFEALSGQRDEEGNQVRTLANQPQGQDNIAKRLRGYFDMQVYGNYKKDEGSIMGVDVAKVIDAMGSYVAINNLALNIYAGFANVVFGSANIRIEAAAGQHFSQKDLAYADKTYTRELPAMLGQFGKRNNTSKLALFTEYFDTLQSFESDTSEMNNTRTTIASQLVTTSSLFFINHAGEHFMQNRTALALANTVKLTDREGNEVSLYDAMEVRGNKLVLKTEFEGQFTKQDMARFRKKAGAINQSLHGIYNKLDRSYMQQRSYLRLVMMFRKFMIPAINRRWGKKTWNYSLDDVTEGYYRAAGRFAVQLFKDIKRGQFAIATNWNNLTNREKQNFMRTFYEAAYMMGFLALSLILMGLADDDKDNWAMNMLAYQSRRVFTEFAAYMPIPGFGFSESLRIVKSPAAAIGTLTSLNNFIEALYPPNIGEEMTSGQYKGWSRWQRYGVDLIPLQRTLRGWMTPEEKLKYFSKPVF